MSTTKKILIADDEPDILEIIQFNLQQDGYEVITAKSGDDAVEKAKKHHPDLIILDIMMPGKTGIEVCNLLRMMPEFKQTLIIFLSAMSDEGTEIKGLETGADDYLTKPIRPKVLLSKVLHCSVGFRKKTPALSQWEISPSTAKNTMSRTRIQTSHWPGKNLSCWRCSHPNREKYF